MREVRLVIGLLAACAFPLAVTAQQTPSPRSLGSLITTSPVTFGAVSQLVALSDGRVFVADAARRTVVLLDPSLAHATVVLDSTSGKQNSYTAASFLMPFRGDSALWYEGSARAFIVLEGSGRLGRVSAPPTGTGRGGFVPISGLAPVSSRTLGLIYAVPIQSNAAGLVPSPPTGSVTSTVDSAVLLRMSYETRVIDSLARISTGGSTVRINNGGAVSLVREAALFPFYDAVVATTDGSIVVFHAREYRVDWINPQGTKGSAPRLTYPWQPITDDDRRRLLDSANAVRQHRYDSTVAQRAADSIRTGRGPTKMLSTAGLDGQPLSYAVPAPLPPPPAIAQPGEVPDFREPTGRSAVLADADNHVWIRPKPLTPTPGFTIWDIVSQPGGVVDRVRIPDTRSIAGFAPGVVFLVAHDGGVATLEKVRIK